MKFKRSGIILLIAAMLVMLVVPPQGQAEAAGETGVYTAESEAAANNFKLIGSASPVAAYEGASGGSILKLETADEAAGGGTYYAEHRVEVPQAGSYLLDLTTTPLHAAWASAAYDLQVNGGEPTRVELDDLLASGNAGPSLIHYRYKATLTLQAGENTIRISNPARRAMNPALYVLYIDSLRVKPAALEPIAASPAPGGQALHAGTGIALHVRPAEAAVYYTTDGSDPAASGTKQTYTAPIPLAQSMTIRAYAEYGGQTGPMQSFAYTAKIDGVSASPAGGPVSAVNPVVLQSRTPNAAIYYTVDGTNPASSPTRQLYTQPVAVDHALKLRAMATAGNMSSEEASFDYTAAAQPVYYIEGESYASTGFKADGSVTPVAYALKDAGARDISGGAYAKLETGTVPPGGGFLIQYETQVPQAGLYRLHGSLTPPYSTWSSPYELSVNGGPFRPVVIPSSHDGGASPFTKLDLGTYTLGAGTNTIAFRVTESRILNDYRVMYLDYLTLTPDSLAIREIGSDAPLNVFQADEPVQLHIEFTGAAGQDYAVAYEIIDYFGQIAASGQATLQQGASRLDIVPEGLGIGHYTITAQAQGLGQSSSEHFAIVVPLDERRHRDDSPFALDTAASSFVPGAMMDEYAQAIALTGNRWVRERYLWKASEPQNGQFRFAPYDRFIDALAANDLKVLQMFEDTPSWGKQGKKAEDKLPADLFDVYDFVQQSAEHYAGKIQGWEIWNEPEGSFTGPHESADQLAAVFKAAAIAVKDADVAGDDRPYVTWGGFLRDTAVYGAYQDMALDNGILDYADIYNFHNHQINYDPSKRINTFLTQYTVDHLGKRDVHGAQTTPAWTTEAGLGIAVAPTADFTQQQQNDQARYMVTSAILNLAEGVDKHFWFVGVNYQEKGNNWGILSRNYTPYSAYSAQAAMTQAMGEARYVGKLAGLPQGASGYAFADQGDTVLALWAESPVAYSLSAAGTQAAQVTNIMGAESTVAAQAGSFALSLGADPIYVRLSGELSAELLELPEGRVQTELVRKPLTAGQRVVLSPRYSEQARTNSRLNGGYTLQAGAANVIEVDVYNFNTVAVSGTVSGTAASGSWVISPSQQVELQPMERKTLQFTAAYDYTLPGNAADWSQLSFGGQFGGEASSPSVAKVRSTSLVKLVPEYDASGGVSLRVSLTNPYAQAISLQSASWQLDGESGTSPVSLTIAPGAVGTFTLTGLPQVDFYTPHPVQFTVALAGGQSMQLGGTVVYRPVVRHSLNVDGTLDAMPDAAAIRFSDIASGEGRYVPVLGDSMYLGPSDLSGKAWATWDDEHMYLSVRVTDDKFVQTYTGGDIWQGDAVQFALAAGPAGSSTNWFEYGMALTANGPQLYRWRAAGGLPTGLVTQRQLAIVRDEAAKTTTYELALPWSQLAGVQPSDGLLSLSLLVADNDDVARKGWFEWGSGIGGQKDASAFRTMQFYPELSDGPQLPLATLSGASSVLPDAAFETRYALSGVAGIAEQGDGIYAQTLTLRYDPAKVQYVGAETVAAGISVVWVDADEPGLVTIVLASLGETHAVRTDGELVTVVWQALPVETPMAVQIALADVVLSDGNGVETALADYTHTLLISSTPPPARGDLNGDGRISIADLAIVARAYGITSQDEGWTQASRADLNGDNRVDLLDLVQVALLLE